MLTAHSGGRGEKSEIWLYLKQDGAYSSPSTSARRGRLSCQSNLGCRIANDDGSGLKGARIFPPDIHKETGTTLKHRKDEGIANYFGICVTKSLESNTEQLTHTFLVINLSFFPEVLHPWCLARNRNTLFLQFISNNCPHNL